MATQIRTVTKAEMTRAKILETAADMYWRRSYHSVAMDELAMATQVNKATIYRYFADKREVALAVARHLGEQVERNIFEPAFASFQQPDERLAAIYGCLIAGLTEQLRNEKDLFGCPIAGLTLELAQEIPELREISAATFARIELRFESIVIDAMDRGMVRGWEAPSLSSLLVQILHGAFVSSRLAADPAPFVEAGKNSLQLIGSDLEPVIPAGEH